MQFLFGAGGGNRTRDSCLEGKGITIMQRPRRGGQGWIAVISAMLLPCAAVARTWSRLAPADEYFGRQKISILGIRNELRDTTLRVHYTPKRASDQLRACESIQDALQDFASKYPRDNWLPPMIIQLEQLYSAMTGHVGHVRYVQFRAWAQRKLRAEGRPH